MTSLRLFPLLSRRPASSSPTTTTPPPPPRSSSRTPRCPRASPSPTSRRRSTSPTPTTAPPPPPSSPSQPTTRSPPPTAPPSRRCERLARFPADSASPAVENSVRAAILGSDSSDLERSRARGVARPADPDATATVLTEMELVLAELRGARGLSARSRCLLTALAEAAADELDLLRTRRAAFWRKLRVGVLAATVFSVAAMDAVLLAALLGGPRGSGSHALPPT
ncbi:4-O-methyl-glucuronoyl methylesterase 1 isoform X1 [Triticum aestivum]|uniref:4-O-methyl-glucuronoyl methylesterase 1 isoform X1 n=1 Tax=Triticum aestivum TaxID=4565 RepID=UPI001D00C4CE|nr:4-O-methyl-glucuronoyl methylesterase 1-like isoform X1 [Triticum aestivum]